MGDTEAKPLLRDCDALLIPSGQPVRLPRGTPVVVQQALGGTYTVQVGGNLVRIDARDADALGEGDGAKSATSPEARAVEDVPVDHDEVRRQLSRCYDPEIPVNILDLGLVYSCEIRPHPDGGSHLEVRMTLTAPGCGMGEVLANDVRNRLLAVRGVRSVNVQLVFDPPWDASMMTEAARLKLGLL